MAPRFGTLGVEDERRPETAPGAGGRPASDDATPDADERAMDEVELRELQREIRYLRERYERDRDQRRENFERAWFILMGVMFGFGLGLVVTALFRPLPCAQPQSPPPVVAPER
jgi:hypothetical protein